MFVYGTLAVLCVGNVLALLNTSGNAAFARTLADLEKLGPAQSLTLADPENPEETVELRQRNGHLSWDDQPYHAAYSIAFVHVGKPMFGLITSEPYQEPMNELRQELTEQGQERDAELRALAEQLQGMDQQSPDFADLQRRFAQLRQQFQTWQQEAQQRLAKRDADMLLKAYDEVVAAVEVVADRKGIDIVLRFLPLDLDDGTEVLSPDQAQAVIRGRAALKYPDALDITNDIMEELSLDIE